MFKNRFLAISLFLIIAICTISAVNAEEITDVAEISSDDIAVDELSTEKSVEEMQIADDAAISKVNSTDNEIKEIESKEITNDQKLTAKNTDNEILSEDELKNAKITFYKQTGSTTYDKKIYLRITDTETGQIITGTMNYVNAQLYKNGKQVDTIFVDLSNGKTVINFWSDAPDVGAGTFTLKILDIDGIYDENYNEYKLSSVAQTKFSVKKHKVTLKAKNLKLSKNSKKKFPIKVVGKMELGSIKVKYKIYTNNKFRSKGTIKTNSKGIATFNKVSKLGGGNHKFIIGIDDPSLTAKSITAYIIIGKQAVTIKPAKLSTTYKSGKAFRAKIVDSKTKKPVKGVGITLKVYTNKKAKTINLKSNSKGIIKYSAASKLKVGTHKVVLKVKSKAYKGKSKTSTIKIKKAKVKKSSKTSKNRISTYIRQGSNGRITFMYRYFGGQQVGGDGIFCLYGGGKELKNQKIKVYSGSSYLGTIKSGVSSFIPKRYGSITFKYAGSSKYAPCTYTTTLFTQTYTPTYTPPTYTPPVYTPPVYTPPVYTPPRYF